LGRLESLEAIAERRSEKRDVIASGSSKEGVGKGVRAMARDNPKKCRDEIARGRLSSFWIDVREEKGRR